MTIKLTELPEAPPQSIRAHLETIRKACNAIENMLPPQVHFDPHYAPLSAVESREELDEALKAGGTIELGSNNFGDLVLRNAKNLKLKAVQDSVPQFRSIHLRNCSMVWLDGLTIGGGAQKAVFIQDCDGVEIAHCDIRDSLHGLSMRGSSKVFVKRCQFFANRGDNLKIGPDCEDVLIESNDFETLDDPANSDNVHQDHIQVFTRGATKPTKRVTIRSNNLFQRQGATQGIFIRNADEKRGMLDDLLVEDNLVVNAHKNGIVAAGVSNSVVRKNTVVWSGEDVKRGEPEIRVTGWDNVVTMNMAFFVDADGSTDCVMLSGGHYEKAFRDPHSPLETRKPSDYAQKQGGLLDRDGRLIGARR